MLLRSVSPDSGSSRKSTDAQIRRAAQYGFDHLLVDGSTMTPDQLKPHAVPLTSSGVQLLVRLSVGLPAADSPILVEHPEWHSRHLDQNLPDPRRPARPSQHLALNFGTAHVSEAMLSWWTAQLIS